MSALMAYFIGILTILVIILPFWVLSMRSQSVSDTYKAVFCNQAL